MKFAAIFPGQGSQHAGMGKFLFDNFQDARVIFEEASDAIKFDLKKLCFSGSDEDLALTKNTQPALLVVSTATFRVLAQLTDIAPVAAAGHSIGEYAALTTAGVIDFADAVRAVRRRGEAMQDAVPVGQGAMAAIMGLTPEQVVTLCEWTQTQSGQKPLEPANFNCPGQIVISGRATAIEWLQAHVAQVKEQLPELPPRMKVIPLKVSAPFHCTMMKPAEQIMRQYLEQTKFHNARFAVVQNFTALPVTDGSVLRENLVRQISAPVRWIECVQKLKSLGATRAIEFGCGKVLSGLVKKIDSEIETFNLNSLEDVKLVEGLFKH